MFAHETLDARVSLPFNTIILVPTDMHEMIGKDGRHLSQECIEKFVSAFSGRIHHWIEDPEGPLNLERPRRTGEIGISDKPGSGVPGHIELGHDADTAIVRVSDNFASLLLGVEQPVRAELRQFWEGLALDSVTLVFAEMPMEDVELNRCHAVERTFYNLDGHEVACAVDHQSTPTKTWRVVNRYGRDKWPSCVRMDELFQSFEAVHRPDYSRRSKMRARGSDFKRVGLVLLDRLDGFSRRSEERRAGKEGRSR